MPSSLGALTQHSRMLRSMKPDVFGAYYNNKQPQNGMMGSVVCRPSSSSVQVNFLSLRIEASVARVNQRKDAISSLEHFLLPTQQQRQQHQLLCTRLSMHGTGISNCSWRATAVKELPMGGWQEAISSFQEVGDDELAYSGWDLFNIHSRQFRQVGAKLFQEMVVETMLSFFTAFSSCLFVCEFLTTCLQILVSSDIHGSNKQQIWYILDPSNSYLFHKVKIRSG